ncbi:MAG: AraC family transcriptional regulator [Pseudomonadota bacterium]|nr:AraC family transcriptional regulator [Pseudomonadota bacterium]
MSVAPPLSTFVAHHRKAFVPCGGPPSVHSYGVLGFYVGGQVRVQHRGELDIEAGHVHVLPAGDAHRILASRGADMWGLAVCRTCLSADRAGLLSVFDRVRAGALPLLELPPGRQAHVIGLLEELQREQATPNVHRTAVTESLLTLILAEVARASRVTPAASPDESSLVPAALALIEARCLGPLTLDEVARTLRRTPAHLTTAVRLATGRTVGEWIRAGRLAEARRRLVDTDECVDIIAERVGYADPRSFARSFRREHGVAPGAFRRAERAERAERARP